MFNLFPIFVIIGSIAILWVLFALIDCINKASRREVLCMNGIFRVFYMGFFEILLTLLMAAALTTNSLTHKLYIAISIVVIGLIFGVLVSTILKKLGPE